MQVYISSGRDALEKLNSNVVAFIIERMKPELKDGNYGKALNQAVVDIGMALSGDPPKDYSWIWWPVILVTGAAAWVAHECWGMRQRRAHRDAGTRLQQMQRDLQVRDRWTSLPYLLRSSAASWLCAAARLVPEDHWTWTACLCVV